MPKPTCETWFQEGTLVPGVHYGLLKDDLSDLEERIDYFNTHPAEAGEIIQNANAYTAQFKDQRRERLISILVLYKYFGLSGQVDYRHEVLPRSQLVEALSVLRLGG